MDIRERVDAIGKRILQILYTPNRRDRLKEWKRVESEWRELIREAVSNPDGNKK